VASGCSLARINDSIFQKLSFHLIRLKKFL
jgi:hypothetical protein